MNAVRKRRLFIVLSLVALAGLAIGLMLYALGQNINLFYSPADIAAGKAPVERQIRAGGIVRKGSLARDQDSLKVRFTVTDFKADVPVQYDGILPDLFREGQGIVVIGHLNGQGVIEAGQVLAKHDENYMPKEVADVLKKEGMSPTDYRQAEASGELSYEGASDTSASSR